jgi:hypothetical protein
MLQRVIPAKAGIHKEIIRTYWQAKTYPYQIEGGFEFGGYFLEKIAASRKFERK